MGIGYVWVKVQVSVKIYFVFCSISRWPFWSANIFATFDTYTSRYRYTYRYEIPIPLPVPLPPWKYGTYCATSLLDLNAFRWGCSPATRSLDAKWTPWAHKAARPWMFRLLKQACNTIYVPKPFRLNRPQEKMIQFLLVISWGLVGCILFKVPSFGQGLKPSKCPKWSNLTCFQEWHVSTGSIYR